MRIQASRKALVATVAATALIGGGVSTVAPAVADDGVEYAASTNWKKIWNKKLVKYADQRYYTKAQSDAALANYSTKADTSAALGNYYTKGQSDAAYAPKMQSCTKAESDVRYAPYPTVYRGTWALSADDDNHVGFTEITYPQLSAAPAVHFIDAGAAPPAGCSGTVQAPNAQAGHLCIFEGFSFNMDNPNVMGPEFGTNMGTFGGTMWDFATSGASHGYALGTFAVRPTALAAPTATPAAPGTNALKPPN
jgi:hypothetical protein